MQIQGPAAGPPRARVLLRWLIAGSFAALLLLTFVIVLHAFVPLSALVLAAQGLGGALVILASAAALDGIFYSWRRYPQHRGAIVVVVGVTLATLLAHAYIIGTPASSAPGSVSGTTGTPFGDSMVSVTTSQVGSQLVVDVKAATGGSAIADLNVLASGTPLTNGRFTVIPTMATPLQPGDTAVGTWTLSSTEKVSNITVDYRSLSCYDTTDQVYGCIMDEVYYVPTAQHILAGAQCYQGVPRNDPAYCNPEHPPLGKALMAAGMAVFGAYNVVGWRVMPALLGTFSIPLLFGVAWKVSESKKIAGLSAVLLGLDIMFFTQSSGALLDIPPIFFGLAAFFVYVAEVRWWKFDKYVLSGVLLGLAGLAKETALFVAFALFTYILFFGEGRRLLRVYNILKVALVIIIVFAAGLQIFDSALGSLSYQYFTQEITYIVSYGVGLNGGCPWACGWTNAALGGYITPFSWITYYSPVAYYLVSVTINPGNLTYVSVGYYGITNLMETWTVYIWVPLAAYAIYRSYRRKEPREDLSLDEFAPQEAGAPEAPAASHPSIPGEVRFAGLTLIMFAWAYIPYIALFFAARVTYPFYFVDAVPAVAMGVSYWLSRKWFPKWLLAVYLVMVFLFFFVYFPDKGFLPVWLRAAIGH